MPIPAPAKKSYEQDLPSLVHHIAYLSKNSEEFSEVAAFCNKWLQQYDIMIEQVYSAWCSGPPIIGEGCTLYLVISIVKDGNNKNEIIHTSYSFADALQWVFEYLVVKSTKDE